MSTIVSERAPAVSERLAPPERVLLAQRLALVGETRQVGAGAAMKRSIDFLAAAVVLAIAAVPMLLISVLILLDDGWPIIFAQERLGKHGKRFTMFKFRSMRKDAEERLHEVLERNHIQDGPAFKLKDDPRMTRVGRALRRTSLDELPQLWNVMLGTMSLVGPRPPLADEVIEYEDWQLRRLAATPGMTGLWQVSGRSDLSFREMAQIDISYVDDWSLGMDLAILAKTPAAVVNGKGAY
jgi:lipopolysaccharide/colanic/teichoic acid biosynthesis glycosyltransferase